MNQRLTHYLYTEPKEMPHGQPCLCRHLGIACRRRMEPNEHQSQYAPDGGQHLRHNEWLGARVDQLCQILEYLTLYMSRNVTQPTAEREEEQPETRHNPPPYRRFQ